MRFVLRNPIDLLIATSLSGRWARSDAPHEMYFRGAFVPDDAVEIADERELLVGSNWTYVRFTPDSHRALNFVAATEGTLLCSAACPADAIDVPAAFDERGVAWSARWAVSVRPQLEGYLVDWAVAHRARAWWPRPRNVRPGQEVLGWSSTLEVLNVVYLSWHGAGIHAADYSRALSHTARHPSTRKYRPPPPQPPLGPGERGLAIVVSDGDNLGYVSEGKLVDHSRNMCGRAVTLTVSSMAPVLLGEMWERVLDQVERCNHSLIAGPSGWAYQFPSWGSENDALTVERARAAGLTTVNVIDASLWGFYQAVAWYVFGAHSQPGVYGRPVANVTTVWMDYFDYSIGRGHRAPGLLTPDEKVLQPFDVPRVEKFLEDQPAGTTVVVALSAWQSVDGIPFRIPESTRVVPLPL